MVTQQRLKEMLSYDENTGVFVWIKTNKYGGNFLNRQAGAKDNFGYIRIRIDGKQYKAHRLAWLYVYGVWPKHQIDHINMIKTDNRIVNLRDVTNLQNQHNRLGDGSNNSTGYVGVVKKFGKYDAQIKANGKFFFLGKFANKEDAHSAYLAAKKKHHKHWNGIV